MIGKLQDLTGMKFERLTVIGRAPNYVSPKGTILSRWKCKCSCGSDKTVIIFGHHLKSGHTRSCGCLELERRRNSNKNKYKLIDNYYIGYCNDETKTFIIDKEEYEVVSKYCWRVNPYGYIITDYVNNGISSTITQHRLVMNATGEEIVDHINHDTTDNRKCNLRIVSKSENNYNRKISKNNTSGTVGVYWDLRRKKWVSQIKVNGKTIHLGYFVSINDAVAARKEAEDKYFGEYSYDNSIAAVPRISV